MEILKKMKGIKEDTDGRVFKIERAIRRAYETYLEYREKEQNATHQDYLKLKTAINEFYCDQLEQTEMGRLDFDYVPVKMYESMKNHKYLYCRQAIKNLDAKLKKEGIVVKEMLDYLDIEAAKYENKQKEEDVPTM